MEHFRQVDRDVRYLLEGEPSDPGGPLAPRDAAEERLRRRHLDRLGDYEHIQARTRLEANGLPEEETWEPESPEDEAASDDKDDEDDVEDEEDADGSSCERLFIMVITAAVILFVAAGVGFQYYVLAFPVEPLED